MGCTCKGRGTCGYCQLISEGSAMTPREPLTRYELYADALFRDGDRRAHFYEGDAFYFVADIEARDQAREAEIRALLELATEFVNYWTGDNEDRRRRVGDSGGCGMCGGSVHSTTCFVGRFQALLTAAPVPQKKGE
jgi:hypothetical protein